MPPTTVLNDLWIPVLVGAVILAAVIGILRWRLGSSILVILMVWVSLLIETIASVAYLMGRSGLNWRTGLIGFGIGAFAIAGVVWAIYRQVIQPVYELTVAASAIARGEMYGDVHYRGNDEVGQLARAFSEMVAYLREASDAARRIGDGDLSVVIMPRSGEDILGNALKTMLQKLHSLTEEVSEASMRLASSSEELSSMTEEVNTSASQVTETVQQVAQGATTQANQAELISHSMETLSQATDHITHNVTETEHAIENAQKAVQDLTAFMQALHHRTEDIERITTTVKRFADQTNLLALNAAIEAARAGEHGKSFAVVAEEVRRLAENSRESVTEIGALNVQIQQDVERVLLQVQDVAHVVTRTAELAQASANAAQHQYHEATQVKKAVEEMASVSEEQAAGAEEMAAAVEEQMAATEELTTAAQELSEMAAHLQQLISHFRTS